MLLFKNKQNVPSHAGNRTRPAAESAESYPLDHVGCSIKISLSKHKNFFRRNDTNKENMSE